MPLPVPVIEKLSHTIRHIPQAIEYAIKKIGEKIAWLIVAMTLLTFSIAILRYVLRLGWVWTQEFVMYMHAIFLLLGAAYTLLHDEHVRVDIFYAKMTARHKAMVNFFGCLLGVIPLSLLVIFFSWNYVGDAWSRFEGSPEAGGIPGVFLLKTLLPIFAFLLIAQALAWMISNWRTWQNENPAK